jgi:Fe-S cluster biosynthesis and repair protein YggX
MNEPRKVLCRKLNQELPGLPFKPFTNELGQLIYDNVSMQAWQMWLQESPRYINTYGIDLNTAQGREFLQKQMLVFFGLEEGEMAATAWRPTEGEGAQGEPSKD